MGQLGQPDIHPRRKSVVVAAYLAAVFLIWDARRVSDEDMVAYFRRRAVVAAVIAGVVSIAGIFVLRADARYLFDGLTSRGLPFVGIAAVGGLASLWTLPGHRPGARASSRWGPSLRSCWPGAWRSGTSSSRRA